MSDAYVQQLEKEPCTCVRCPDCHGLGTIHVNDGTQPSGWDLDTCEECRGSGISEECERCTLLEEADMDDFYRDGE